MIIIKQPWNKQKVRKIIEYLHTAKTKRDPMTHYMKDELSSEMLYYLLQNPTLFTNQYLYQQFIQMYFPQFASEHPTYTQMLIQMAVMNDLRRRQQQRHQKMYEINYQRLINDTNNRIRQDKRIPYTLQLNVDINKIIKDTTRELTEQHEKTLERTINQLAKQIEKDGLINVPDISKNKKLQEKLEKYNKQIERENKRLEKNRTNRILWQKARLLDQQYQPKYKIWVQHPNPKTRHTITNNQKVPLETKFEVINDKTGHIDLMDYPGDWTGSPANTANCLCTIEFTNDDTNLYKPEEYSVKDAFNELQEKTEKLKKLLKRKGIRLVNDATLLAKKQDILWIINRLKIGKKERNRMRITDINQALIKRDSLLKKGYLKNDFNLEIAHKKIWLDHITSSREMLKVDLKTKQSNSHSYNIISKLLKGRLIDRNKYTIEEINALDFYSRREYYETFNEWQRNNFSDETIENAVKNKKNPLYGRNVNELKELFKENYNILKDMQIELDEDMILYHGQKEIYPSDGEELKEIGEWNNTISLGLFKQSAEKYAIDGEGNKHILYRIYVPKGTKITPILQMSQQDTVDESEVLLGKGYKYKVDSYYNEDGFSVRDSRLL